MDGDDNDKHNMMVRLLMISHNKNRNLVQFFYVWHLHVICADRSGQFYTVDQGTTDLCAI